MSKSTHPSEVMTSETPFAAMTGEMTEMQKEAIAMLASSPHFAGVANLAAHPMGAMAAASALGLGMASQMFGIFAGTMAGAMRAANMLANETTGGHSAVLRPCQSARFRPGDGLFRRCDGAGYGCGEAGCPAKTPGTRRSRTSSNAEAGRRSAGGPKAKAAPKKAEAEVKTAEVKKGRQKAGPETRGRKPKPLP